MSAVKARKGGKRVGGSASSGRLSVAKYLENQIAICGKQQNEIAAEIGYARPNIITMFKQGLTKVPINIAPALAKSIGADPNYFTRLVLSEYMPEVLKAIEDSVGGLSTVHEQEILAVVRTVTKNKDPKMTTKAQEELFAKAARELL